MSSDSNKKYKRPKKKTFATTNPETSTSRSIRSNESIQPACPLLAKDSEWVDIIQSNDSEQIKSVSNVSDEEEVLQLVDCEDGPQMKPLAIMFPGILDKDPQTLKWMLSKAMSTTEVTRHLVGLRQKANFTFMKKADKLIPREKQWLESLSEDNGSVSSMITAASGAFSVDSTSCQASSKQPEIDLSHRKKKLTLKMPRDLTEKPSEGKVSSTSSIPLISSSLFSTLQALADMASSNTESASLEDNSSLSTNPPSSTNATKPPLRQPSSTQKETLEESQAIPIQSSKAVKPSRLSLHKVKVKTFQETPALPNEPPNTVEHSPSSILKVTPGETQALPIELVQSVNPSPPSTRKIIPEETQASPIQLSPSTQKITPEKTQALSIESSNAVKSSPSSILKVTPGETQALPIELVQSVEPSPSSTRKIIPEETLASPIQLSPSTQKITPEKTQALSIESSNAVKTTPSSTLKVTPGETQVLPIELVQSVNPSPPSTRKIIPEETQASPIHLSPSTQKITSEKTQALSIESSKAVKTSPSSILKVTPGETQALPIELSPSSTRKVTLAEVQSLPIEVPQSAARSSSTTRKVKLLEKQASPTELATSVKPSLSSAVSPKLSTTSKSSLSKAIKDSKLPTPFLVLTPSIPRLVLTPSIPRLNHEESTTSADFDRKPSSIALPQLNLRESSSSTLPSPDDSQSMLEPQAMDLSLISASPRVLLQPISRQPPVKILVPTSQLSRTLSDKTTSTLSNASPSPQSVRSRKLPGRNNSAPSKLSASKRQRPPSKWVPPATTVETRESDEIETRTSSTEEALMSLPPSR